MPFTDIAARAARNRLPKTISPHTHAALDYAMAGAFFGLGVMLWKRNRRAALGAFFCGSAKAANALSTDYPGGVTDAYSFSTHGKIDAGLAGITAALPSLLEFDDEAEAKYFRAAGVAESVVIGLTDFGTTSGIAGGKVIEMPKL